ncbi:hypothetical protein NIES4071_82660 [Calothrix sp. NIES-4071]|nr:hypothetical protein NIES4071_82660 [Calothrix sp. NIES-4071]BAZ62535.1 hypothetical protein NIES4105_82590 [Calothrix sp. NIES-4105]
MTVLNKYRRHIKTNRRLRLASSKIVEGKIPVAIEYLPKMSLIELLEYGDWRSSLRRSFEGAIRLLQTDRFGRCSSAVDDVKIWLVSGGVSRVKLQLDREMKYRRLEEDHRQEIRDFLGQLVQKNQRTLLQLMADRIIPWDKSDFLATCNISESDFDEMLEQIASGANHE